jgi:hypothetical protein
MERRAGEIEARRRVDSGCTVGGLNGIRGQAAGRVSAAMESGFWWGILSAVNAVVIVLDVIYPSHLHTVCAAFNGVGLLGCIVAGLRDKPPEASR